MRARDHTSCMLRWWWRTGVTLADLAVLRPDGTMVWHHELPLAQLPLPWARAQNARHSEVYIRPARGYNWPVVLLDDLPATTACRVARRYDSLVVRTSPAGGCHFWLRCHHPLDERQRHLAQRWLAQRIHADPASTSGEHLGRLAGFKNWKRRGCWVNVLVAPLHDRPWIPTLADTPQPAAPQPASPRRPPSLVDTSASGRDWAWVCRLLEAGCNPTTAILALTDAARPRRGKDAERYARHTVTNALTHLRLRPPRENHEKGGLTAGPT